MKAIIFNTYSYKNAGDAAIVLSSVALLHDLGYSDVLISSRYEEDASPYQQWAVPVIPPLVPFAPRRETEDRFRAVRFVAEALLLAPWIVLARRRRVAQRVVQGWAKRRSPGAELLVGGADAVIAGGGYLYSSRRKLNLSFAHSVATVWMARMLSPRVIVLPMSVGPLERRLDRWLVRRGFGALPIVERDTVSSESGRFPVGIGSLQCPDVAFYRSRAVELALSTEPSAEVPTARVVAMDWRWSTTVAPESFDVYLEQMVKLCDCLADLGYQVVLGGHSRIPEHGQDDIEVGRRIAGMTRSSPLVDENCDVAHLLLQYRKSSLVVSTRLHGCIMATTVGAPSVGIAYQEKFPGVAAIAGNPFAVHSATDPRLCEKVLVEVARCSAAPMGATEEAATNLHTRIHAFYRALE